MADAQYRVALRLGGLTRDWRFDRVATVVHPATGKVTATYWPADQHLRKTAITDAVMRKRALYARYLGWAQGSQLYPQGFLGPAGEAGPPARDAIVGDPTQLRPAVEHDD